MKIKIGIYMDEYQAKEQLQELLTGLNLTLGDFGFKGINQPFFHLENDYVRITRHSVSEGSRGHRNHFAICSIKDYDTKLDIINSVVRPTLNQQNDIVHIFETLGLDGKHNWGLSRLRAETNYGVHLDIGNKDFIIASVKVAKAIHEALK